jgi:transcriptional regulator with XRE-family HTH domain
VFSLAGRSGHDVTEMIKDVRRLLVGAALRRHRERLGLRVEDAGRVLRCHPSKISRIETGQRGVRWLDLKALIAEYGISEQESETLLAISDPTSAYGWWTDYADVLPAASSDYLLLEATASAMLVYDATRVPDLLQTADYALAIAELGLGLPGPGTPGRIVDMRLARQQAIMGERRLELSVIIGEGALRRVVGGEKVMHGQLRWLADVSVRCPWVTLQVLPLLSVAHIVIGTGSLAVLRFAGATQLGVVHLPAMSADVCLIDPADVATYTAAFAQLKASALDQGASAQLLCGLAGHGPEGAQA